MVSFFLAMLFGSNVRYRKGRRGPGWTTAEYHGAKGGTSTNAAVQLQAAVDALYNEEGAGTVYLGPYQYRLDAALVVPGTINLEGYQWATYLHANSPSISALRFTANTASRQAAFVKHIGFGALVGNTTVNISGEGSGNWRQFINCSWNATTSGGSGFINGQLFGNSGASSIYEFFDCNALSNRDGAAFSNSVTGAAMNFRGGTYTWPATLNSAFIYYSLGKGNVNGVNFDVSAHTSGTNAHCIGVSSDPSDHVLLDNVRAIGTGGPTKTVLKFDSNCQVRCSNLVQSSINRYFSGFTAGAGSFLEMIPHQSMQTSSFTVTCPDNIGSLSLKITGSPGSAPSITLPAILFPGQEFELLITNGSGGNWSQINTNAFNGLVSSATNDGFTRTLRFRAMSMGGNSTYSWVCVGTASAAFF